MSVSQSNPARMLARPAGRSPYRLVAGLLVATALAALATMVGQRFPLIGAPVAGSIIGVCLSGLRRRALVVEPGVRFAAGNVLQLAVVLLGSQLSLRQIATVGTSSLPVMLGTLTACLAVAYVAGRWMGIDGDLRTLIGVGTAICGASAIAATSPVIKARDATVAYAISTVFCFNIAAVVLFPPLGHLLHLSQHAFGLLAGTAVNDTSSVVAAATTYGREASDYAIVVKLTRALMIIPICVALGVLTRGTPEMRGQRPSMARRAMGLVPWFLIGFVVLAGANSMAIIPAGVQSWSHQAATFLITVALVAIGMSADITAARRAGARPMLLGGLLWVVVTASSLLLQRAAS